MVCARMAALTEVQSKLYGEPDGAVTMQHSLSEPGEAPSKPEERSTSTEGRRWWRAGA